MIAALLAACAGAPDPGGCPVDVPDDCPDPAPTWADDVEPVFDRVCRTCHVAGGLAPSPQFADWQAVYDERQPILAQVAYCWMPPADAPVALTDDERADLVAWLVCGAPED